MRNRLNRIRNSPAADDLRQYGYRLTLISLLPAALVLNFALRDFAWVAA